MGIIQNQTIKGSIYSFLGVFIGFVTSGLLFPHILLEEEIGLVNLLVSFSVLFAQLGSLGFNNVINRLFPYFRNQQEGHKGFLLVAIIVSLIGFILVFGVFQFMKPNLISNNIDKSPLFVEYINYIIPLVIFTLYFDLFDNYNRAIYDAVLGTFLKEFIQRILILISLLFYYYNLISIHLFIQLYVVSVCFPTILIIFILIIRGEFKIILPDREIFTSKMIREMGILCVFGIISGFGSLGILHIDRILVNKFLDLGATGIYAINFFFATLVLIPSRSLLKISTTIIADSWKKNVLRNIFLIYKKSVINQAIIGLVIFNGLWINIDNIYKVLPPEYMAGKWVIIFVALGNVIAMASGVSGTIIGTSKYYKYMTYFIFLFFTLIISLNFILIPALGLAGAGLTFLISTFIFNLVKYLFVLRKFKMNPYNYKIIILIVIAVLSGLISKMIREYDNLYFDIIIRSSAMIVLFVPLIYVLKISEDLNRTFDKFRKRF